MSWQNITYFISIIITAAVMGFIAWYSRRNRKSVAGAGVYMWIAILVSTFSVFQGISMISPTEKWALFWFNIRIMCLAAIPVIWLVFVLHYVGKQKLLSKTRIALLFVIPVITQAMLWTNGMHGLWVVHDIGFLRAGPFFIPDTGTRVPGPWMNVHNLYTYAMMLTGIVILFTALIRMDRKDRGQAVTLGIGTLVMIAGSLFPALNLVPGMILNPLPQSFALGSVIIAWGLYRHRFLGAAPLYDENKQIPQMLVTLFFILTGGILILGFLYYRQYENHFRAEVERQLSSVADLKVNELVQWRKERLGDANMLYGNPAFTAMVRRFFSDPADMSAGWQIRIWLEKILSSYDYNYILLLDAQGSLRMPVSHAASPMCGYIARHIAEIRRTGKVIFVDFHREAQDKPIHLSVIVPVISQDPEKTVLGFVVLFIDPTVYLYPMLNRWPTHSRTAETLIVRRDGNDVLFLNELKFKKNTALSLREPLTNERLPAVMAAKGQEGIVEGIDYRGVPVVGALRAVPGSPWFMVARMDAVEVYAPVRERFWAMITAVMGLIAGAGAGTGYLWRRQGDRFIRERIEAAEMLRESEAFTRAVLDNLPVGIAVNSVDPSVTFTYMNDNFPAFYRTTRERITNPDAFWDAVYEEPGFREEIKKRVIEDCASGDAGRMFWTDIPITRKGEGTTFITSRNIPIPGKDLMISTVWDITERKQAEEALLESERRLRETQEMAHIGYWNWDIKTGNVEWSKEVYTIFRFDPREFTPQIDSILALSPWPEDHERDKELINRAIESHEPGSYEQKFIRQDKSIGYYYSNFQGKYNEKGDLISIIGTVMDITERKLAEEERKRFINELELSNVDLQQFAYVASHDLQEPLRMISSYLQLIEQRYRDRLDADANDFINFAVDGAARMHSLINGLLEFSRVKTHGKPFESVKIKDILDGICRDLELQIAESGAVVDYVRMPVIKADESQIARVFQNLVQNAIKFRQEGTPPRIQITAEKNSGEHVFCVRDNGIGMEEHYLERIFVIFQRLHSRKEYPGTGIGLSICKRIVERHGGRIWVESKPGEGSAFYFSIPAVNDENKMATEAQRHGGINE